MALARARHLRKSRGQKHHRAQMCLCSAARPEFWWNWRRDPLNGHGSMCSWKPPSHKNCCLNQIGVYFGHNDWKETSCEKNPLCEMNDIPVANIWCFPFKWDVNIVKLSIPSKLIVSIKWGFAFFKSVSNSWCLYLESKNNMSRVEHTTVQLKPQHADKTLPKSGSYGNFSPRSWRRVRMVERGSGLPHGSTLETHKIISLDTTGKDWRRRDALYTFPTKNYFCFNRRCMIWQLTPMTIKRASQGIGSTTTWLLMIQSEVKSKDRSYAARFVEDMDNIAFLSCQDCWYFMMTRWKILTQFKTHFDTHLKGFIMLCKNGNDDLRSFSDYDQNEVCARFVQSCVQHIVSSSKWRLLSSIDRWATNRMSPCIRELCQTFFTCRSTYCMTLSPNIDNDTYRKEFASNIHLKTSRVYDHTPLRSDRPHQNNHVIPAESKLETWRGQPIDEADHQSLEHVPSAMTHITGRLAQKSSSVLGPRLHLLDLSCHHDCWIFPSPSKSLTPFAVLLHFVHLWRPNQYDTSTVISLLLESSELPTNESSLT